MEGQTIQWSKDTKVVITSRKWKDRQYNGQKIPKWLSQAVNGRTNNAMVKRYQRGNHKPQMEGQRMQWSKDTKVVITSRIWKDRQYNGQKIPKR